MKKLSIVTQATKSIKTELKTIYPKTKFSLSTHVYANGTSIRVKWTDGATYEEIQNLIKKYQYGEYDPLEDCYRYTNTNDNLPQVKYVTAERTISEENYLIAFDLIKKCYEDCKDLADLDTSYISLSNKWDAWTPRNMIYRRLCKIDLTNGFDANKFKGNE